MRAANRCRVNAAVVATPTCDDWICGYAVTCQEQTSRAEYSRMTQSGCQRSNTISMLTQRQVTHPWLGRSHCQMMPKTKQYLKNVNHSLVLKTSKKKAVDIVRFVVFGAFERKKHHFHPTIGRNFVRLLVQSTVQCSALFVQPIFVQSTRSHRQRCTAKCPHCSK